MKIFNRQITVEKIEKEEVTDDVEVKEEEDMGFFKRNWKKLAAGAAVLGAGAVYLATRNRSDEDDYDDDYTEESEAEEAGSEDK